MTDGVDVLLGPIPHAGDVYRGERDANDREAHLRCVVRGHHDLLRVRAVQRAVGGEPGQDQRMAADPEAGECHRSIDCDGPRSRAVQGDGVAIGIEIGPGGRYRHLEVAADRPGDVSASGR